MDEQRTPAERRRALLVKVIAVITALEAQRGDVDRFQLLSWPLYTVLTKTWTVARAIRELADGALAGVLEDDAAWMELLTMMLQEVADGSDECAH